MPDALTAPPRIFVTHAWVSASDLGDLGACLWAPYAFDLARLVGVRALVDEDTGEVDPSRCILDFDTEDMARVRSRFADVLAAWCAYRTHADALRRLTN